MFDWFNELITFYHKMPNYHFYKISLIYSALDTEVLKNHQLPIFKWQIELCHQPR